MESNDWKEKSIRRTVENKALKKRIKELTHSRDVWKNKSIAHKARVDSLEYNLKKTKRLIEAIVSQSF